MGGVSEFRSIFAPLLAVLAAFGCTGEDGRGTESVGSVPASSRGKPPSGLSNASAPSEISAAMPSGDGGALEPQSNPVTSLRQLIRRMDTAVIIRVTGSLSFPHEFGGVGTRYSITVDADLGTVSQITFTAKNIIVRGGFLNGEGTVSPHDPLLHDGQSYLLLTVASEQETLSGLSRGQFARVYDNVIDYAGETISKDILLQSLSELGDDLTASIEAP